MATPNETDENGSDEYDIWDDEKFVIDPIEYERQDGPPLVHIMTGFMVTGLICWPIIWICSTIWNAIKNWFR